MNCVRFHPAGKRRKGAALVELAVCLPVLVMVVLGIIEFGRAMMVSELLTEASREGARQAIISGASNSSVSSAVTTFLQSTSVNPHATTVTITITPATGNPDPGNQIESSHPGDLCTIAVQVPFSQVAYVPGTWLGGSTLTGLTTMRHE